MRGYRYVVERNANGNFTVTFPDFPSAFEFGKAGDSVEREARRLLYGAINRLLTEGQAIPAPHYVPSKDTAIALGPSVLVTDLDDVLEFVLFQVRDKMRDILSAKTIGGGLANCRKWDPDIHRLITGLLPLADDLKAIAAAVEG